MLSTKPEDLLGEIRASEELRKRFLVNTVNLVRRYAGNWYRNDSRTKPRPENMIFGFVSTLLPDLIFDNPAVAVTAKRTISHAAIAEAMEMGENGWIKEVDLKTELEMVAVDMLFGYGCIGVGVEERSDFGEGKHGVQGRFTVDALTPFAIRKDPANVFIDPQCDTWRSARFVGEMFQRDLEDLQGDNRYDQEVVKKLTADDANRSGKTGTERAFRDNAFTSTVNRGRVTLYQIYIPELRQIGTLTADGEGQGHWIRPLAAFHGPAAGPYCFFGVYTVPNQVYPLSPIAAMAETDQELNAHATAAATDAATAKNLVLVSAEQGPLAEEIQRAASNSVIKVKGLNGNMVLPVAVGGTTVQRLEYLNMLLQRTDRVSGQSEAARGKAQGVTATEANLAHTNADARVEFMHLKFRDGVKDVLTRVGWYMYHDPSVVSPVSSTDPQTGQKFEGLFLGGIQPGQEDTDWSGFFLDIEPMSMRRIDPAVQAQHAQLTVELVTSIAPLIPQMPFINWSAILDMIGQANNMPDFAKTVLNQEGLMMIGSNTPPGAMGAGPGAPPGPGASPTLQAASQGAPIGAQQPQGGMPPTPPTAAATPASMAAQAMLGKRFGGALATGPGTGAPWGIGPQ
ncbi:MAG TPA: hypothetical protein VG269_26765 [Tepidisphaeraceae bacterium]|nr:hypothetical protein [Tepidisphaeraceae bacterium]